MKIAKRPTLQKTEDAFMEAAPDAPSKPAKAEAPKLKRARKIAISLTIPEELLGRLDEKAAQLGQSRAAFINLSIARMLEERT